MNNLSHSLSKERVRNITSNTMNIFLETSSTEGQGVTRSKFAAELICLAGVVMGCGLCKWCTN